MQNDPNNQTLTHNFGLMSLKPESKYDEDSLDEAILNGLKGDYRDFCRNIESFLNNFMKGST